MADPRLYSESLTVQTFVNIENTGVVSTLVGNMDATKRSGWKLGCESAGTGLAKCCFTAFVGHNWRADMRISLHNPPTEGQQVCTTTPLMANTWYHLAATYTPGATRLVDGQAVLFVNGALAARKNFVPLGDMGGAFTEYSSRINYDYIAWQPGIGQWDTTKVATGPWYARGSYTAGDGVAPASFVIGGGGFAGRLDETRVWTVALTETQLIDTAYEIGAREPNYCSEVRRVASVDFAHVTGNLTVYVSNNDTRAVAFGSPTDYNNMVKDDEFKPSLFSAASLRPALPGAPASGPGFMDAVWAGDPYIEREPRVTLREMPSNVLREIETNDGLSVEVLFRQGTALMMDLLLRDPNYDDVLEVRGEPVPALPDPQGLPVQRGQARFVPDYLTELPYNCYRLNGLPFRLECSQTVTTGWSAFRGAQGTGYEGPIDVRFNQNYGPGNQPLVNPISGENMQRHRVDSCREYASPNPAYDAEDTFPAATRAMSQIAYRIVWAPDLDLEWYVPSDGLTVQVGLNVYDKYRKAATGSYRRTQVDARAQVHVRLSPEWLTETSFPDRLVGEPGVAGASKVVRDAEGRAFMDQELHVGVGEQVVVNLRARDRNLGDALKISAAEDPGLPPGESVHSRSRLQFEPTPSAGVRGDFRDCFNASNPLLPPRLWDRTLVFAPSEDDLGQSYRSCFKLEQTNSANDALMLDASALRNLLPLCVTIHVAAPAATFNFSSAQYEAILGCETVIPFSLGDASAAPYALTIVPVEDDGNLCHSAGCQRLPGGLPQGAVLVQSSATGQAQATLTWTPTRGQDLHEAYKLCFEAQTTALNSAARGMYTARTCIHVKVRKCQYCVQPGESLDSLARSLGMDHLQMYMLNPYLPRPDQVHPKTVVTTGSLYEVREGDFLERLGRRFLVPAAELQAANPDVEMGGGQIYAGQQLCVRAPLCDVDCRFDTDCVKRSA